MFDPQNEPDPVDGIKTHRFANDNLTINPATFRTSLLAETGRTTSMFEDRYERVVPAGNAHTVLDWFTAHIGGSGDWVDRVDEGVE